MLASHCQTACTEPAWYVWVIVVAVVCALLAWVNN